MLPLNVLYFKAGASVYQNRPKNLETDLGKYPYQYIHIPKEDGEHLLVILMSEVVFISLLEHCHNKYKE